MHLPLKTPSFPAPSLTFLLSAPSDGQTRTETTPARNQCPGLSLRPQGRGLLFTSGARRRAGGEEARQGQKQEGTPVSPSAPPP